MISALARAGSRRMGAMGILGGIAVVAALVSLTVTLLRLPTLLAAVYRFSDAPELSYISQGLATGHGPQLLPTQTSIGVIWFDELLQWVPFRAGIEYWTGPVLTVAMGLLLVRTAHVVLGRKGTLLTSVLLLVLPTVVLWPLLFPDNHITTYAAAVLLAWHLVLDLRCRRSVLRSALVGIILGVGLVTDPQLLAFGVVPYIATIAVLRRRVTAQQVRSMLGTLCAAVIAAGASFLVMRAQGISTVSILPGSSGISGVIRGIGLAVQTLAWTIGGGWYGHAISVLAVGLCIVAALSLVAMVIVGVRQRVETEEPSAPAPSLDGYALFWGIAFIVLLGAFVFLGYGAGGAPMQGHYLVGCYLAAAALLPVIVIRYGPTALAQWRSRGVVVALVAVAVFSVFAVNNAVSTATFDASLFYDQLQVPAADDPLPVLLAHGLTRGYAGYWESYDLDWRSNGVLSVWPLLGGATACSGGAASLCPYDFAPKGEYTPTAGSTFIITPWTGESCGKSLPSAAIFGPPEVVYTRGPYTISVYGYDVASRLSKDASLFC